MILIFFSREVPIPGLLFGINERDITVLLRIWRQQTYLIIYKGYSHINTRSEILISF